MIHELTTQLLIHLFQAVEMKRSKNLFPNRNGSLQNHRGVMWMGKQFSEHCGVVSFELQFPQWSREKQ